MAMLAPALRWPDILPSAWQASMQGQLDAILPSSGPLSNLTPSFLVSLFVSLVTLSLLLSLRSRSSLHPHAHAASVASGSQRSSRRKVVGDATVLLTGPSNSGKTSLALSLSLPRASSSSSSSSSIVPKTHTSQVISRLLSRTTSSSSRSFTLVDVPGDNRLLHLRDKQLNSVSSSSNNAQKIDAIVFCVDSASGNLNAAGRRESIGIAHAAE
ncbi:hypothetical protein IE81DRAFT_101166 [Ceraceosorus guamensis]|uniref:Signal recognition particle receptor subunit beta n=1 Tax=Ceraceosorus guamensis TaxID=1522189 RepID=A0A316VR48_9BASI|nr:hypothetical protein IE81DRAFT_101166 [Ceraceosorus guamensis]PWN38651.1 hypothetical protein IE81DRAFT_101166 [Ceraceosorus guamensis]